MKKVGILGATGLIGSHYLEHLKKHPFFKVHALAASEKSANTYIQDHKLRKPLELMDCDLIFSALPQQEASAIETYYAKSGITVFSNSSGFRMDSDIPLLIPEINPEHLKAIPFQKKNRDWKGAILAKPNCCVQSFLIPLAPLHKEFGLEKITVTMLQAISGAGFSGLPSFEIFDNIIPYIPNEEEKAENEPLKILGDCENGKISLNPSIKISAHCNRVPVLHGHLACVSVLFKNNPSKEQILEIWKKPSTLTLPSSPKFPIVYHEEIDRPQPRLDRDNQNGMGVSVGRLRPCPIFHWRFTALSHNAMRGGAGSGITAAELLFMEQELG